jgi:hypothetical protein
MTFGIGLELFVSGAWADITQDLSDEGVTITRGRANEGAQVDPARMECKLRNTDGRYSPRNPRSPLYGLIGRNTPVRFWEETGTGRLVQDAYTQWACPSSSDLSITGDIDIRVDIAPRTWRPGEQSLFGVGKDLAYKLILNTNGTVGVYWHDGSSWHSLTSTVPLSGGITGRKAVRMTLDVDNGKGSAAATFYHSDSLSGEWSQVGAVVELGSTTVIGSSTNAVGTYLHVPCEMFGLEVRDGIDGDVRTAVDWTTVTPGATTYTDAQGNTWAPYGNSVVTNRHYRFVGNVTSWPQRWTKKGASTVTSPIECAGILRRLGQGNSPLQSVMRRGCAALPNLVGYWPMEDADGARSLQAVIGAQPGRLIGDVDVAAFSGFAAADHLPTLGTGRIYCAVTPYQHSGEAQIRWLCSVPDSGVTTEDAVVLRVRTASTLGRVDVHYKTDGRLFAKMYTNLGVLAHTTSNLGSTNPLNGKNKRLSLELKQNGSGVDITLVSVEAGYSSGVYLTENQAGITLGQITSVDINPAAVDVAALAVGHLTIEKGITSIFDLAQQFAAYAGERADTRMLRLAAENELSLATIGAGAGCERMGPQHVGDLLSLMRECATSDGGILYEPRGDNALRYRSLESLWTQDPAAVINYTDNLLQPFEPIDDDEATRNRVTVTRAGGGSYTVEDSTGPLGTQPPPDGVGIYDEAVTLSLATDEAAEQQAGWRVHLGTTDEARWPSIGLDLAHPTFLGNPDLTRRVLSLDIGDRLDVEDLPTWLPPFPVRQIIQGYTETITPPTREERGRSSSSPDFHHKITFNCTPANPYNVGTYVASEYETSTTSVPAVASTVLVEDDGVDAITNGTALDAEKWTLEGESVGGTATYQDGALAFSTGDAGGYDGDSRITCSAAIASLADVEITGTFRHDTNEAYPIIVARATVTTFDYVDGYYLRVAQGSPIRVGKLVTYSGVILGFGSVTPAASTTYGFRFRVVDDSLKARVWTGDEPETWDIDITDSTYTEAGKTGISVGAGNAAVNHVVTFDDVVFADAAASPLMSDSGSGDTGDGTPLDVAKWTTEGTSQGDASATYQGGALAFSTGDQGGYAGTSRLSRSFAVDSRADGEVTGTFAHDENEAYPLIMARATTDGVDYPNGYGLQFDKEHVVRVRRVTNYSGTTLASTTTTPVASTTYGFRFRVVDDALKARVWTGAEGDEDPNGPDYPWDVSTTDSTYTAAGKWGITVGTGNDAIHHVITLDDVEFNAADGTADASSTDVTPIDAAASDTRYGPGSAQLAEPLAVDATTASVTTGVGPLWTTDELDCPLELSLGGEHVTVTAVTGEESPQTFTITRAVNGITKAHDTGTEVTLLDPSYWGSRPLGGILYTSGGGGGDTGSGDTGSDPGETPGTPSPYRSTLPWCNAVFDNTTSTSKFDAFQAMTGQLVDMFDGHPEWEDIDGSSWWYEAHIGRAENIMMSVPMYHNSVTTSTITKWTTIATALKHAGWDAPYFRLGIEYNLSNSARATDSNFSSWKARFAEAATALRAVVPKCRIVLCPNEGHGDGELSYANTLAMAVDLVDYYDIIGPDYYDQWEPIYTTSEAENRFGSLTTFGTMNYWLGKARLLGKKFAIPEWGVSSGTQWEPHAGGDNPFYIGYLMDWVAANVPDIEMICYFEEDAGYLESDITTNETNPQARAKYQAKITQYAGTLIGGTGGGSTGTTGSNTVRIGTATYPLSGVNPGTAEGWGGSPSYPGDRGVDQLIVYTDAYGTLTDTNQWGVECPADADQVVNSQNDRQPDQDLEGTTIPSGGFVLSGHGAARTWLLTHATEDASFELLTTTGGDPGGGTGGGGTGGGTIGEYEAKSISVYKKVWSSSSAVTAVPSNCTQIRLAFAQESPPSLVGYTTAGQSSMVAALAARRAAGQRIVASIGGAGGDVNTSSRSTFLSGIASIKAILEGTSGGGLDGIDWDIETGASFPTSDVLYISTQLKSLYGQEFAITMAPNGNNVGAYLPAAVRLHQANALDDYGQQFYDASVSLSSAKRRVSEAINAGLPASKISVGMMTTSDGGGDSRHWSLSQCTSYMTDIKNSYGVTKCYIWTEDGHLSAGTIQTWVNNMRSVFGM